MGSDESVGATCHNSPLSHGGHIGYDVCTLGMKSRRCVSNLRFAGQTKIISVCPDVPLCSNNRSKGKLGITFHRFSVDKYAKESWIVRIRGDVGKNFQVSDCGLRLQAKQASSVINLFKVIWSTRIMCRAELLFYSVPYVLLLPVIKRYNCSLDFEKQKCKGLLGIF